MLYLLQKYTMLIAELFSTLSKMSRDMLSFETCLYFRIILCAYVCMFACMCVCGGGGVYVWVYVCKLVCVCVYVWPKSYSYINKQEISKDNGRWCRHCMYMLYIHEFSIIIEWNKHPYCSWIRFTIQDINHLLFQMCLYLLQTPMAVILYHETAKRHYSHFDVCIIVILFFVVVS